MPDPAPEPVRPLRLILALAAVALALVAGLGWLNRKALAREALVGWLRGKGVPAEAEVEAIGPSTFTARIRLGDPARPDFTAERAEVRYRVTLSGLEVVSATLRRPVLSARLHGSQLSVGALDPLVRDFLRRPPRPNARKPRIGVEGGVLALATDYGTLRVTADALIENNQVQRLTAVTAPARLTGPGFDVNLGPAFLREALAGGRVAASLDAPLLTAAAEGGSIRDGRVQLKLEGPYPDLVKHRGEGALIVAVNLSGRELRLGAQQAARGQLSATFAGRTSGWISNLLVAGRGRVELRAEGGAAGAADLATLSATAQADDLRWSRTGGDRVTASLRLTAQGQALRAGEFNMASFGVALAGPLTLDRAGPEASLAGGISGRGGWTGFPAPAAGESAGTAAVRKALRSFRVDAPGVLLQVRGGEAALDLPRPLRVAPDSGGAVLLTARGSAPIVSAHGGAFRLSAAGGGLPQVQAEVSRLELTPGGARALWRVQANGSAGAVVGGALEAAGALRMGDGGLTITADRCAALKAERLELGANDVGPLSGRFCPAGAPLLRADGTGWRLRGRAEGVAVAAPFAQVRGVAGAGRFEAASHGGRMDIEAKLESGRLEDAASSTRFSPMALSGSATLARGAWRADLDARLPGGPIVARAHVLHDGGVGTGFATFDTGVLTFADGGLQPAQLSPLAAPLGSPAVGSASFTGRFDWSGQGVRSRGELSIPRLDFQSPAGKVEGLKGEVAFTSLAPLVAAPNQLLSIQKVDAIVPLTQVTAHFELANNLLSIHGGEADVGGGKVRVESLDVSLTPDAATQGVLLFDGVQLHDIVEASPFGDRVELDAKVSGRVPFTAERGKVRVIGGELKAIQPGRLSIDRTALTGVATGGAVQAPGVPPAAVSPNDTFTDFAYQAMENLAFDTLEASIQSQADGRLGVVFHIVGRHDPPQKQQIRIGLMDLIQRRFLGRKLPLPSGTGVNLTLDTTLNLDQLLADYADYRRLHGSGKVQP